MRAPGGGVTGRGPGADPADRFTRAPPGGCQICAIVVKNSLVGPPERTLATPGPRNVLGRAFRAPLGVTWDAFGVRFGSAEPRLGVNCGSNLNLLAIDGRFYCVLSIRCATWEFVSQHYNFNACKPSCSKLFRGLRQGAQAFGHLLVDRCPIPISPLPQSGALAPQFPLFYSKPRIGPGRCRVPSGVRSGVPSGV